MTAVVTTTDPLPPPAAATSGRPSQRSFLRRFLRKPLPAVAAVYLLLITLMVIFAGVLAPYGPDEQDLADTLTGPSAAHWLGAGNLGMDVLSRIMYGGRITLLAVVVAMAAFVVVGVPAGVIAGYKGGWVDRFVVKSADLVFAIPVMIVLLVVLAIFPYNEVAAMATMGLLGAPGLARVVRSVVLGTRNELYVRAAKASGIKDGVIIRRHILPLVIGTIIIQTTVFGCGAIMLETGLGYLGLGTQSASWGNLVAEASQNLGTEPWLLVPSGFIIITVIMAMNLAADGVRDAIAERQSPVQGSVRRRRSRRPAPSGQVAPTPESSAVLADTPTTAAQVASDAGEDPLLVPDVADRRTAPGRSRRLEKDGSSRAAATKNGTAQPDAPLMSVRDLSVSLPIGDGLVEVIRGVTFDVGRGEAIGIVGESGCGKTITARSLLGLLPPGGRVTGGSIVFDGTDLAAASTAEIRNVRGRRIGWISQDPIASLDPCFTAGHQVSEAVRAHRKCSKAQARARTLELFAAVQLPDPERIFRSYPHQLSGGMAQRVGIAAALAGDPEMIVADEPTTALDVTVQAEILDVLRSLQANGTSIVLITHDWGVLADLCRRAVVMYAGEVVERALVQEIVDAPEHPYTAALLRSDPHHAVVGQALPALEGVVPPPTRWPVGCHFQERCAFAAPDCAKGRIPMITVEPGRDSRCIRTEELVLTQAGHR